MLSYFIVMIPIWVIIGLVALLTRDKGMHNVMMLLKDCGFWDGISVFIDPKKDMEIQISQSLI